MNVISSTPTVYLIIIVLNHVLHLKRSEAWKKLLKKIETEVDVSKYESEMRDFMFHFFVQEKECNIFINIGNENQLKTWVIQREPSIKLDSIPKEFYEKCK